MTDPRLLCCFILASLMLCSTSAQSKISHFDENDDSESSGGYEFLDDEVSGSYAELLDEYLIGSGGFPLENLDSDEEEEEGSASFNDDSDEEEYSDKDDFPLEDIFEEDDIHFVENVPNLSTTISTSTTTESTEEDNRSDEPDSTFLFANRFLFFILYGAAIMVLFVAILLVICLLIQCRKKRKDSMDLMNKARVMGINNSLSKNSRDSIIIDCYRIHKNPLGYKV